MSQRDSGYARQERDAYMTPEWVTEALIPHLPEWLRVVDEPACGTGNMVRVFQSHGLIVNASDIETGDDFLKQTFGPGDGCITNPPYDHAQDFIEHALGLGYPLVAMLLRTDFDHAASRKHLFADCKYFSKKLILRRRIRWFEGTTGSPSFNHCWVIWSRKHRGLPKLVYGP